MARKVTEIYLDCIQKWYDGHKFLESAYKVPYRYMEQYFREELACKKKTAFDWIVELSELYGYPFDGSYIIYDAPRHP